MMINATDFEARIKVCSTCEVFNVRYKTCGPPTNAINPFKKPHTLDGITFKPCGCPVDHLAAYAVTDCPAKRWPMLNANEWKVLTLQQIRDIRKRGAVQSAEMQQIFKLRREYLGIKDNKSRTSCTPCMNDLLDRLERSLAEDIKKEEQKAALTQLTQIELTTEPIKKKRRAKRKKL